jgi:hypothetical protein
MILLQGPPPPPPFPMGAPPNGPFAGPCGDAPCVPIDQYAIVLIICGLLLGYLFLKFSSYNQGSSQYD